jgi:hypothetical protein
MSHIFLRFFVIAILALTVGVEAWYLVRTDPARTQANPAQSAAPFDPAAEQRYWSSRIRAAGSAKAYEEFKRAYAGNLDRQHAAAHIFGSLLYKKEGIAGLVVCDATFSFGCYHSFFASAISEQGIATLSKLDAICIQKFGPLGSGCQHGIGHGILEYMGHDKLLEGLTACKDTTKFNPLFGCVSGVFMEYYFPTLITPTSSVVSYRAIDAAHPYAPCPSLPGEFRRSCYYELTALWSHRFDARQTGAWCGKLKDMNEQRDCFKGIGFASAPAGQYDIASAIAVCAAMPGEHGMLWCRAGATWSFSVIPEQKNRSSALCDDLAEPLKQRCVSESNLVNQQ